MQNLDAHIINTNEEVREAIESGQYSDFLNGETDMPFVTEIIKDILQSGLSADILGEAGVKVYQPLTSMQIKKDLNLDKFANKLFEEHKLIAFPYPQGITRYKIIPAIGKMKYIQPKESPAVPYILPSVEEVRTKQHKEIWITEGEKKTLCLLQNAEYCIGLSGVWNFKGGMDDDLWAELKSFVWKSRLAYVAFDSDLHEKPQVRYALYELAFKLHAAGAVVKFVTWDPQVGKGIDDYLVAKEDIRKAIWELKQSSTNLFDFVRPEHKNEVVRGLAATKFGDEYDEVLTSVGDRLNVKVKHLKKEVTEKKHEILQKKMDSEREDMELQLGKLLRYDGLINLPKGYIVTYDGFDIDSSRPVQSILSAVKYTDEGYEIVELCKPFIVTDYISTLEGTKQVLRTARGQEVIVDVALSDVRTFDNEVVSPLLGVTLPRWKIQQLIDYVHAYQQANRERIYYRKGMEKTGWHKDTFYIPTRKHTNTKWMDSKLETSLTLSEDEVITMEKTRNLIGYLMKTPSGIIILAALSAPLLRKFKVPNFILHTSGLFLSGKSCSEFVAMSLYGNPNNLRFSWNSTGVGREIIASMYQDLPIWIEEFEESKKSVREFKEFSYQYVAGQGRARGQKNIKMREIKTYSGILLSSAEKDLDTLINNIGEDDTKKLGLYRRVIEINAEKETFLFPVDDTKKRTDDEINSFINGLYRFAGKNYGWFGKKWIEYVEAHLQELESIYRDKSQSVNDTGGLNSAFAIMLTVLHSPFMQQILHPKQTSIANENLLSVASKQGLKNREVRNIVSDFIEKTLGYLHENGNKVNGLKSLEDRNAALIAELVDKELGKKDVFIFTTTFDRICKQFGFSREILLRELFNAGKLKKTEKNRYITQRKVDGCRVWGYYLIDIVDGDSVSDFINQLKDSATGTAEETPTKTLEEIGAVFQSMRHGRN